MNTRIKELAEAVALIDLNIKQNFYGTQNEDQVTK